MSGRCWGGARAEGGPEAAAGGVGGLASRSGRQRLRHLAPDVSSRLDLLPIRLLHLLVNHVVKDAKEGDRAHQRVKVLLNQRPDAKTADGQHQKRTRLRLLGRRSWSKFLRGVNGDPDKRPAENRDEPKYSSEDAEDTIERTEVAVRWHGNGEEGVEHLDREMVLVVG